MSETWPGTLPFRPLLDGYDEAPPDTALRTEMDAGPAKQRRRYTAGPRPVNASILVDSKAKLDIFDAFYVTTLQNGVLAFDWQDRNGATKTFRFIAGKDACKYEPVAPQVWAIRMKLEVLP